MFCPSFQKYIGDNSQMMYGAESHIVAALMGGTAMFIILLVDKVGPSNSVVGTLVGAGLVAVGFSALLKLFAQKYGGYPYRFLF